MKRPKCQWCKSADHGIADCEAWAKRVALQERIAERQAKSWAPRKGGRNAR